jgi:flagellar protein FlaG
MDVVKVSQGGQSSFDNIGTRVDIAQTPQGNTQTVVQASPAAQKSKSVDQGNTGLKDNNDPVSEKELKRALDKLSGFLNDDNTTVDYEIHDKFHELMIKITDKNTNQVILEIPPKKILDLVAKMMEMVGILFDKMA